MTQESARERLWDAERAINDAGKLIDALKLIVDGNDEGDEALGKLTVRELRDLVTIHLRGITELQAKALDLIREARLGF